jgi:hypothetical protein
VTCGAVVGAKVPIALTSRSANEEETYLSLVFCAVLDHGGKESVRGIRGLQTARTFRSGQFLGQGKAPRGRPQPQKPDF